jgi:hypothetical protein
VADEQTILEYIIRAQENARGLLEGQTRVLQQMATAVTQVAQAQQAQATRAQASVRANTQQGDSLDKLIRQYDAFQKSNERTKRGFEAMQQSLQGSSKLSLVQAAQFGALGKAVQGNSQFMTQYGAQWTALNAQMTAGARITPQMTAQLGALRQNFQQVAQGAGQTQTGFQQVQASALAAHAAVGLFAAALGQQLISQLNKAVEVASRFQSTFIGLGSISRAFGQDINRVNDSARELAADGLISVRDSAVALRNLMMSGFNLEQAVELAKGFKDIASFNRQASLELGYAVTSATEGIKNQNSLLVDNAGLTKNLTIILKEMGLSEQDLGKIQTDVNIRTKFYNGLLREMRPMLGDAARLTDTYQGSQAALNVQIELFQAALGEQLMPILQTFNQTLSQFIGWLRNSTSATSEMTRVLLVATGIFVGLGAAAMALVGVFGAVTAAGAAMGLTLKAALIGTGWGAVVALIATSMWMFARNTDTATESLEKQIDAQREHRELLINTRNELDRLKETSASQRDVQDGLNRAYHQLKDVIPNLTQPFKDLDDAIGKVNGQLQTFNATFIKTQQARVQTGLQEFGENEEERLTKLFDLRKKIRNYEEQIQQSGTDTEYDRNRIEALNMLRDANQKQFDTLSGLMNQQQELARQTKAQTDIDNAALAARQEREAAERRFGELTKGQISTAEAYSAAAKKLAADLQNLTSRGMTADAAKRLPEMVKAAKELYTASREGVAPMDDLALSIIRLGESLEYARRLEQEAIERSKEQQSRIRQLTFAYIDQTKGVDSMAGRMQLLNAVMKRMGVDFDSSRERLMPFLPLLQEIVNRVETLGEAAPEGFDSLRDALMSLPGGKSPLAEIMAANRQITLDQEREIQQARLKIIEDAGVRRMQMEAEAFQTIRNLRDETLEESETHERDTLKRRQDLLRREFERNTRDLDLALGSDKRIYDAYFALLQEQLKQAGITWDKEILGRGEPTRDDLEHTADVARQSFEFMRASGTYSANQIREAWLAWYEADKAARSDWVDSGKKAFREILETASEVFERIAQIGGDSINSFVRELGLLVASFELANEGQDQFAKGMAAWKDGEGMQGILSMTAGIFEMAAAFQQATSSGNQFLNTIGGAQVGSQLGESIGGMFGPQGAVVGMIAGGIIGGIVGAFKKPEWKKVQNDIRRDIGESVSQGMAQQIADFAKNNNISRQMAELLNLNNILQDVGGLTTQNYAKFTAQAEKLLGVIARGGKNAQLAIKELDTYFGSLVERMNTDLNGMADQTMLKFIARIKESGQEVKAVTDFLKQMADAASEGLNKVVAGLVGASVTNFDKLRTLVDETLPDLLQKEDALLDKIAGERDPRKLESMNAELVKLREEIQKAFTEADRLNGGVSRFAAEGQESFNRVGRLIAVTFDAGIGAGKSFIEMLDAIGPSLDTTQRAAEEFGLELSDSVKNLLGMREIVNNNRELADSIGGLNQLMKSLNNLGAINSETFQDLGQSAVQMRDDLLAAGATGDQAFAMMQPSLQTLWELQRRFGYETDEATQKLLDEAVAAGAVGKQHMSAQERMVAGIDKMVDRMERLLTKFGVDFPADAEAGSLTAQTATGEVQTAVTDLGTELDTMTEKWVRYGDEAEEAGRRAYEATYGVIYGHSPGGLTDVQEKLEALKKQWAEQGRVARGSMEAIDEHVDRLNAALHDLARAGMNDFQRSLDDIEMRRQSSIASFIKDMEGAAQEMIDLGIEAINKTADIQASQTVWEQRHAWAAAAAAQAKTWADALREVNEELVLERAGEGIQRTLLELGQQRQAAIEGFLETMQGASAESIQQGLAAIEEIFNIRVRRAQEVHQDEILQSTKEHVNAMLDLVRELEDVQMKRAGNSFAQQERLLRVQFDRRLADLAGSLGAETQEYRTQAAIIERIYNEMFGAIQDEAQSGLEGLQRELEDLIVGGMEDGLARERVQLQMEHDRRMDMLREQFGEESDAYRAQAEILEEIFRIKNSRLTEEDRKGSRERAEEELRTLQEAFYELQNTALLPGQEDKRREELERLAARVFEAQGRLNQIPTTTLPPSIPSEATGTLGSVGAANARVLELLADREARTDTLRLHLVFEDENGRVLGEQDFQSIEEAMATGKIRVNTRAIVKN